MIFVIEMYPTISSVSLDLTRVKRFLPGLPPLFLLGFPPPKIIFHKILKIIFQKIFSLLKNLYFIIPNFFQN